ncbi:MAG: hypothetical protein GY832_29560 [Chloroflexi bacterium]|nr:hypothetical protein [Chloroflexota bacterium]
MKNTLLTLAEYESYCNQSCLKFLMDIPCEFLMQDMGFGWKSLHGTMFHIVDVMQGWETSVHIEIKKPIWLEYRKDFSLEYIGQILTDASRNLVQAINGSHAKGVLNKERRLHQFFHIIAHGTHHRGQLFSMLSLLGYDHPFEGGDFGGWSNQNI